MGAVLRRFGLVVALLLLATPAWGAIAFDNASNSGSQTTSPVSFTLTVNSATNGLVVVGVVVRGNGLTIGVSATFAGSAMTQIRLDDNQTSVNGAQTWLGYIFNTSLTGSQTIQVTVTGTFTEWIGSAISLTGVLQSGQPDAQAGNTSTVNATSLSATITTVADQAWVVDVIRNGASSTGFSATGTSPTQTDRTGADAVGTNLQTHMSAEGGKTPAGAYTDGWSWTTATSQLAMSVASFSPAAGGAAATPQRMLLGVGQ